MAEKVVSAKGDNPQFIFDSNLANFDTAVSLIDKTLNKGLGVRIIYSYRNVIDAWKSNLERAGKHERVVALNTFIRNHLDAPETLIKLAEKYQDNPNVKFELFNQNIKNNDKSISFDKLKSLLYDSSDGKISRVDAGKRQTLSRGISESIRDGGTRVSRAQKEASFRKQAQAIATKQLQDQAISEQVYRGALRGHLDERKFTAGKTSKKSPIKSPTKVKQMK